MQFGAVTQHIDVAQLAVAAFALFFLGLVWHLRREDKREGYPLTDPAGGRDLVGFPDPPDPKTFKLMDGGTATMPHHDSPPEVPGRKLHPFPGSPLVPYAKDPVRDSIGPSSYALRKEKPLIYEHDKIQVLPMRALEGWSLAEGDADPRGMAVLGADNVVAGVVRDVWIDRSVKILRYIEVEVTLADPPIRALLPIYHADINRRRNRIRVSALLAAQFKQVPPIKEPDEITAREEDQINAFFAGARFWRGIYRKASMA